MGDEAKPLVWLHGEIRTPPLGSAARVEAGALLRRLQGGEKLGLPHSRPMPTIGARCHELRIQDKDQTWRVGLSDRPGCHRDPRGVQQEDPADTQARG